MRYGVLTLLIASTFVLSACANLGEGTSDVTRSYLLAPVQSSAAQKTEASAPSVGVGPVELAPYLDRPQIVTRSGQNQLVMAAFDQWAAPLQDTIVRVLAEDIEQMTPAKAVVLYPWRRAEAPDYQVTVDVARFDGALAGPVTLKVYWTLFDRQGKVILQQPSLIEEAAMGPSAGYPEFVAAMNRCLNRLSQEISQDIQRRVASK